MPHQPDDPLTCAPSYLLAAGMAGGSSGAKNKLQLFTFYDIVEYFYDELHTNLGPRLRRAARPIIGLLGEPEGVERRRTPCHTPG